MRVGRKGKGKGLCSNDNQMKIMPHKTSRSKQTSGLTTDMACKSKITLTQAEWEKIKKANAKRAKEVRENKRKGKGGEKEGKGSRGE